MIKQQNILSLFEKTDIDQSWAFADKTRKDTSYITHGYHRYPAKFIPQIVSRLVEKYTKKGDLVVDPFGGCGTTLVESKIMCRSSVGVDINPVAVLMTKAKKTPIEPNKIGYQFLKLKKTISSFGKETEIELPEHERIDYWFKPEEKRKLAFLFSEISKINDQDIRYFFYCGFSNILKNCSIWLQKSNKPTRDLKKEPTDPFIAFSRQIKTMLRGNADFFNLLQKRECIETPCDVYLTDARKIPTISNSVSLIVTSPPYVTSYEYADLHQLTALWFEYTKNLSDFRKRFIGTSHHNKKELILNSNIAKDIRNLLIDYGRFGYHLPDVDIVIYDPKTKKVIAVISSKVTLRERIAQTGYWKIKLQNQVLTKHIKVYFVTPDEDRTLAIKNPAKKGRAIVEIDTDGSYVLSETDIEASNKVKMFDRFIDDLKDLLK